MPGNYEPKPVSLATYRKRKLKILSRDFCIHITDEEKEHANTLTTKTQVDQFCIDMMDKYWG